MRTRVGLLIATVGLSSILAFSTAATATTPPTDNPPPSDDTTTTTSTTTSTTSTTTSTTTTTIGGPFTQPGPIGGLTPPVRPGSTFQTDEPPPAPTTTTTTLPPPDLLPANSGSGRRAVYSKSAQRVWAVDDSGAVIKTHRVSGRLKWCDPRPGTYSVWSRSRYTNSINNPTIKWGYMVRFTKGCNGGNIGFHEIPSQYGQPVQTIAQLGQPLSGGCVRQWVNDAIWMWNWAQLGTQVVVLP